MGAEVIAYGSGTLEGPGEYNLSYLRRGLYGTTPQEQVAGATVVRLDGAIFQLPMDPGMAGKELLFKFCSFNMVGRATESLADVTAYPYTVPSAVSIGGPATLLPRGSCAITKNNQVYKMSGGASAWDTDCVSTSSYSAVSVSAQYAAGQQLLIGLTSSTAASSSPSNVGYYIYADGASDQVQLVGAGVTTVTLAAPSPGDLYNVTFDGFTVRYYVNGILELSAPATGSLYIALGFYDPNSSFSNVETSVNGLIDVAVFRTVGNCIATDTYAQKTGSTTAWDAMAYSILAEQQCHIQVKGSSVTSGGADCAFGLASAPLTGSIFSNIDFCWYYSPDDGAWYIYESGTLVATENTLAPAVTDVASITCDGTTVTYTLNGTVIRTTSSGGVALYGVMAFKDPGSGFNFVDYGVTASLAVVDTGNLGTNAATTLAVVTVESSGTSAEGGNVEIASVSVGPFPYATSVVVTATGYWENDGTRATYLTYGLSAAGYSEQSQLVYIPAAAGSGSDVQGVLAIEYTFSLDANTAGTYYLYGSTPGVYAVGVAMNNIALKAEVIKR